jgi:large subunit ribosomal protein L1
MGKIRVKTFGDEELEQKEAEEAKARKEARIVAAKGAAVKETVEPKTEEIEEVRGDTTGKTSDGVDSVNRERTPAEGKVVAGPREKKEKEQKSFHSKKYQTLSDQYDKSKVYSIKEALELLEKLQRKSFDETVELHLNTASTGVSGQITLPHGTGKTTRVAIATDELIAEVEKGIINFDVLVAEPTMMAKLAKVAKVLGPRGLMPNPKNGTITPKPEEVAKKYAGGQINFKTEAKAPIIHLTVGKISFGPEKLTENIEALIVAIKKANIVNATLKSTMSPGFKIKI